MVILEENPVIINPADHGEDHPISNDAVPVEEHVNANRLNNYYSDEDTRDSVEARRSVLRAGRAAKTEIQQFYKNQCIFITGGTGFLGKVLLEKLLRSCTEVDSIYVLARPKKGKDAKARVYEQLDEFVYHRANEENPKGVHKIVPIEGDVELPRLGVTEEDWKMLTSKVTIIINAAATVKFDEKLIVSTAINVRGTKQVLRLAKECRNLKAMTHVSTAFSNTHVKHIEEKFYEPPIAVETLEAIANLDQDLIDSILPQLLKNHPNTYCFTKAIAEEAVRTYGEGMPICIVRPSIVISSYDEPVRGWTDSILGPTGLIVGVGVGALRTMYLNQDAVADMVPVDMAVNAIIASAWYTARNFRENQTSDIPIYNYVSGAENPVTWGEFVELNRKHSIDKPTTKALWYYGLTMTNNYNVFLFLNFFLHYIPVLLLDAYSALTGKRRRMLKLYHRAMKMTSILFFFSTQDWQFSNDNVQNMWKDLSEEDKTMFFFSISKMSWDYVTETFLTGLRVYILKDELSTLPEARKKWRKLFFMHMALKTIFFGFIFYLLYTVVITIANLILG